MAVVLQPRFSGSGRPLVLQGPAWGPSNEYLRLTLAPLLGGCRVITYEPRNVGSGPRVERPDAQATEHLVDDLEGLRRQLDLDRFALAGHSHGGFIAMAYAVRHPERVDALLLLNTRVRERKAGAEADAVLRRFAADPQRAEAVELFRGNRGRPRGVESDADLARQLRRLMPAYFYDLEAMRRFAAAARGAPPPSSSALQRLPSGMERWVERGLPGLEAPALVVTGRYDVATPPADARRIHDLLPHARLEIFERSGHHPWIEEPERFTGLVDEFLAGLAPDTSPREDGPP